MKNVFLGTTSEAKLSIIKECLGEGYNIIPKDVQSGIPGQPLDEKTTITGAINRAKRAIDSQINYDFSIGLEGGLTKIGNLYYLVCVSAIVDKNDNIYLGISDKLPLPKEVSDKISNGEQFGEAVRDFMKSAENKSPDFISHIEELINRKRSFSLALNSSFSKYQFEVKTNL